VNTFIPFPLCQALLAGPPALLEEHRRPAWVAGRQQTFPLVALSQARRLDE
jgi:hypothetical protein